MTKIAHIAVDAPSVAITSAAAELDPDLYPPAVSQLVAVVVNESEDEKCWMGSAWRRGVRGCDVEAVIQLATAAVAQWPGLINSPVEATVALLSDAQAATLNAQFRGINKPTNVLSFPADSAKAPPGERPSIGDIALAEETILREAAELGIDPCDHLCHLVVHGLLHLIGYDHNTDKEAAEMEALETAILASAGVADPYAGTDVIAADTTNP